MKVRRRLPSPREEFRGLLRERGALPRWGALAIEGDAKIKEAIEAYAPGRKKRDSLERWEIACIARPIEESYLRRMAEVRAESNWLEHRLNEAAYRVEVLAGDEIIRIDSIMVGSYSTQGWGASRYAEVAAELRAEAIRRDYPHVPVEVVPGKWEADGTGPVRPNRNAPDYFEVRVRVHETLDAEVLRRAAHLSLREWIAECWKRGANPRVYQPFLPHGIEERLGLDYQGRDLRQKK